jgi:two-component system sensor histidine kinase MtrB
VVRHGAQGLAAPVRAWRRSLELRVVLTTLLLSGTVVLLLGIVLLDQVNRGLVEAARRTSLTEAEAGVDYLRAQLRAAEPGRAGAEAAVEAAATTLVRRGAAERYELVLLSTSVGTSGRQSRDVDRGSIPPQLREVVGDGESAWAFTRLVRQDASSGRTLREPALAVGAPVAGPYGSYELYHLFPLTAQAQTLDIVRRTLLLGGLGLVLLLAAIAYLVTRTVVTPVRNAAGTAQRLAEGLLDERMAVRGEDDLARLAVSFNSMAAGLQRQIVQLEELSRVQQRFVSDVSHELRTPLTTVRMAADVLHAARADFPAPAARSAELLQTELDRFERLLADLLEISRHDAGAAELDLEPVDLRTVVQRVADSTAALSSPGELELRLPDEPVVAEVDARRVERVLRNLVVNAVEHGEGRAVTVTIAAGPDAVAVTVRDRGVGLRPGEAEQVFRRFWRGDPSRARRTGGTGLGLSIASEDARLHRGRLEAWGEPGHGALFRLTLPVRAGEEPGLSPLPLQPADVGRVGAAT